MQISAKALDGMLGDTTLAVLVKIGKHLVLPLDNGSNTTFPDTGFVEEEKFSLTPTSTPKLLIVGEKITLSWTYT